MCSLGAMPLTLAVGLSACVETGATQNRVGPDVQDGAYVARFAEGKALPLSAVRVNAREVATSGNAMIFVQAVGGGVSAACEVNDTGRVVAFIDL